MTWTEERIAQLKKLWTKGLTSSQIAEELGVASRNAVIGKAHRLGLQTRPNPLKGGEESKARKAASAKEAAASTGDKDSDNPIDSGNLDHLPAQTEAVVEAMDLVAKSGNDLDGVASDSASSLSVEKADSDDSAAADADNPIANSSCLGDQNLPISDDSGAENREANASGIEINEAQSALASQPEPSQSQTPTAEPVNDSPKSPMVSFEVKPNTPQQPLLSQAEMFAATHGHESNLHLRSIGPGGFLRQGPGDTQAPIPPAPPRRLVPAKPSPEIADKASLLDLTDKICKWPLGHPGEPDFHFCGEKVNPGFPYCVQHCGSAYQAQLPRRDRRPPPVPYSASPRLR